MTWQDWYTKYAKYYHVLDGAAIDYPKFAEKLMDIFKEHNTQKILDFACGIGKLDIELKKLGYDITGVDLNNAMLKEAKINAKKDGAVINFIQGDPRKNIVGKFDAIIFTYNYAGHFSKSEFIKILLNFKRNLNKNGLIFFDIFNYKFMEKNFIKKPFMDVSRKIGNISAARINRNKLDKKNKLIKINQTTYIQENGLKVYKDNWDLKIYSLEELKALLSKDFEIIRVYGSIFGDNMLCPYSDERECIVVLAKSKQQGT